MFYQQDWYMRQIEAMVQIIARIAFKRNTVEYEIADTENLTQTDMMYKDFSKLVSEFKICEAEDMLFENFRKNDEEYLKLAVDFYQSLNKLSDEILIKCNFSREEIKDGLEEIMARYEIDNPLIFSN